MAPILAGALTPTLHDEAAAAEADLRDSGYVGDITTECRDRWHENCPDGVVCGCWCHLDEVYSSSDERGSCG